VVPPSQVRLAWRRRLQAERSDPSARVHRLDAAVCIPKMEDLVVQTCRLFPSFAKVHTRAMFRTVLVAYDGSAGAKRALDAAIWVAWREEAELIEEHRFEQQECARLLKEAEAYAASRGRTLRAEVRIGHPAQQIVRVARALEVDLIVIGHSGLSAVWGPFLGTTAEKVSRHAPCSVLLVR